MIEMEKLFLEHKDRYSKVLKELKDTLNPIKNQITDSRYSLYKFPTKYLYLHDNTKNSWTIVPQTNYLHYHLNMIMVLRQAHYTPRLRKTIIIKGISAKSVKAGMWRVRQTRKHSRKEADFELILPNGCTTLPARRIIVPKRFK
jgi:hypothetical protein